MTDCEASLPCVGVFKHQFKIATGQRLLAQLKMADNLADCC